LKDKFAKKTPQETFPEGVEDLLGMHACQSSEVALSTC
jgi:hypothetical protein